MGHGLRQYSSRLPGYQVLHVQWARKQGLSSTIPVASPREGVDIFAFFFPFRFEVKVGAKVHLDEEGAVPMFFAIGGGVRLGTLGIPLA